MENRFLFKNGAVFSAAESPPVTSFLEAHPGAYTTTRTHSNGSQLLFWERHMNRLSNSFNLLLNHEPRLLFGEGKVDYSNFQLWSRKFMWDSLIRSLVDDSIRKVMMPLLGRWEKKFQEEMAITILLSVNSENLNTLRLTENEATVFSEFVDVYLHIGGYVPPVFGVAENSARLAIVGRGRDFANAKYSDWIRLRKPLEKLRPPSITELVLSNDGDRILEGCLTNFFVVCFKEKGGGRLYFQEESGLESFKHIEIQSAPVADGVLPGVIRQVIKETCFKMGLSFREIAPSWSSRGSWIEAFITSSLRIVQPVETIRAPVLPWDSIESNDDWKEISWVEKRFQGCCPGRITAILQKEVMKAASVESLSMASLW